jgi:hypothetical protein
VKFNSQIINKFTKLGWDIVNKYYYPDGTLQAMVFKAPRNCISFRRPKIKTEKAIRPKRVLSEEHKKAMQEARRKNKE